MRYTFKQVLDKIRDFLMMNKIILKTTPLLAQLNRQSRKKQLFMSYSLRQVLQVTLSNMMSVVSRLLSKILPEM